MVDRMLSIQDTFHIKQSFDKVHAPRLSDFLDFVSSASSKIEGKIEITQKSREKLHQDKTRDRKDKEKYKKNTKGTTRKE